MKLYNYFEIIKGEFNEGYELRHKDRRIWGIKKDYTFVRNDRADQYFGLSEKEIEELENKIEKIYEQFMQNPDEIYQKQEDDLL
jgi:hypothetical protein